MQIPISRVLLVSFPFCGLSATTTAQPCPIGGAFEFTDPNPAGILFEGGQARLADLNGDGIVDAFGSLISANGIGVRHGNADGSFDAPIVVQGIASYRSLSPGDLDGDGFTDLIGVQYNLDRQLIFFRNDGAGGFEGPVAFDIPNLGVEIRNPSITTGDLDGDGGLDLVVALISGANRGYVFWQDPVTRTYSATNSFRFNTARPRSPRIADLDGDGEDDVVYAGYPGDSGVLWNEGGRAFTLQTFPTQDWLIPVGDLNGDGDRDLVGLSPLAVYESDPAVARAFSSRPITSAPSNPIPLEDFLPSPGAASADFDQDGDEDIVVTERVIGILRNREALGYQFSARYMRGQFETGEAVATSDYNGDGMPDLAVITSDAFTMPNLCTPALPCPADLAPPAGVLDLADIGAFVAGFTAADPVADLNPDGVFDLADIAAFVNSFNAGCP